MDKQLRELLDIFHEYSIMYWLDSGTLLGLMREGRLLAGDKDLDLAVWEEEGPKLQKILPLFRQLGYQIYSASYRGKVFKYNLTPRDVKNVRTVDINLYRRSETHAWCPMYYFKLSPVKEKAPQNKKSFLRHIRGMLRSAWKSMNAKVTLNVKIDRLPWAPCLVVGTWWIPHRFYQIRIYDEKLQAYLPQAWEDYLAYRYGSWRQPQDNWVFYRDDGGINPSPPNELLQPFHHD